MWLFENNLQYLLIALSVFVVAMWGLIIISLFKSKKYFSGGSLFDGIAHVMPWLHKTSEGKMWAKRYWIGLSGALIGTITLLLIAPKGG